MSSLKILLVAIFSSCVLALPAWATSESWQFPNLKTRPPRDLELSQEEIKGEIHNVLRFSNTVYNAGEGPLELRGEVVGDQNKAYQRVWDAAKNFKDFSVGNFVFHTEHDHWHFEDFARYELWTKEDYRKFNRGIQGAAPLTASKATFCVIDVRRIRRAGNGGRQPVYVSCDPTQQGLSVGWGDTYGSYLFDQWIDLGHSSLADGEYVLRSVADPVNRLKESADNNPAREGDEDNAAIKRFTIRRGKLRL